MDNFQFDDQEDGLEGSKWEWGGKDATIFVIDSSEEMLRPFDRQEKEDVLESPFTRAIRCVHETVCRKIISCDKDIAGVLLYNSNTSKNAVDSPYIYVLQDIEIPSAERILELEAFLTGEDSQDQLKDLGSANEASLHDVLWVCRNMFNNTKTKLATKNIILFTYNDDPHCNDDHKKRQAYKGSKDVYEAGIQLEILPLSDSFDMDKFYKGLLTEGNEEDARESISVMSDPTFRFEELLDRVRRFEHKQRTTGRIPFCLAPGIEMGVKVYTTIRKSYKPSGIKLSKIHNEVVRTERRKCLESGEQLLPSELVKYQVYGGKKLKFSLDEVKHMNKVYKTGITLLGFKSKHSFRSYHYIKPASFIFPDEDSFKGSLKLFTCLLNRCLTRNVCPLVRIQARENSSVSWAFLLPQNEERDEKNAQIKPPGFHVCYLPFADDFRNIEIEKRTTASDEQVEAAEILMKKLYFKYHPGRFENPDLQTHWRNIEALALNRTQLEPVTDYTVPDNGRIEKKAGSLIEEFKSLVLSPGYDPDQAIKKRPVVRSTLPSKKPKLDASQQSVEDLAKFKMVDKLSVPILKKWLQEKGIKVTGKKKQQLVLDIYEALNIQ